MTTPLDPAIRVGRRALDARRREIGEAAALIADLQAEAVALARETTREAETLAANPALGGAGHLAVLHARRADRLRRVSLGEADLDGLRVLATEEAARLRALEGAAERWRDAARAEALRRDGAEADDLAAARFLLARATAR